MLGSGNPLGGANPAGTGSTLNFLGNHVYAYSGTFPSTNSATTMFEFTTGSEYIVGEIVCNSAIDFQAGNIDSGVSTGFRLSLNSEVVALLKTDSGAEDMPSNTKLNIILAPFTKVTLERLASGTNSGFLNTATFTGEVYK